MPGPKKCIDLSNEELRDYLITTNGHFQTVRSFLRLLRTPGMIKDSIGRVLYMNAEAEKLFGVSLKAYLGKTMVDFAPSLHMNSEMGRQDGKVLRTRSAQVFFNKFLDLEDRVWRYTVIKFPFDNDDEDTFLGWIALPFQNLETQPVPSEDGLTP